MIWFFDWRPELPNVKRLVFAMGGVEGASSPPTGVNDEQLLMPVLQRSDVFDGTHHEAMDVTGGIRLKVARGFRAAESGVEVHLVSGEHDGRERRLPWSGRPRHCFVALMAQRTLHVASATAISR